MKESIAYYEYATTVNTHKYYKYLEASVSYGTFLSFQFYIFWSDSRGEGRLRSG